LCTGELRQRPKKVVLVFVLFMGGEEGGRLVSSRKLSTWERRGPSALRGDINGFRALVACLKFKRGKIDFLPGRWGTQEEGRN